METETDARGNKATAENDARGIGPESRASGCAECGADLRATGPGRRPVYCGRACSSKAYRRRRTEYQQDAVADALVSSRVEIPGAVDAGHRELLELAAAVRRATARYLENLELARRGEGDDPRCNQALALLETGLTSATQRIVRQAHVLRYEMTSARLRAEREAAQAPSVEPAASLDSSRVETPATLVVPTGSAPTGSVAAGAGAGSSSVAVSVPDSTRAESTGRANLLVSSRVETGRSADAPLDTTHAETVGPAGALNPSRVETPGLAAPLNTTRAETADPADGSARTTTATNTPNLATVPKQLRLALATAPTAQSPLARGLGAPTSTWNVEDTDLAVEGWGHAPDLFAVRDTTRRLLGWVEKHETGWGTWINGRLITDATDGQPWLSSDAPHAVTLLRAARDQQLT
ncbi:hypothetical protein [Kitasatospora purpeofusca]|uniref:hypothetical protein n=1 Tax=Kitasatospora purpeofusca TaxID=67352 RepID=UPI00364E6273